MPHQLQPYLAIGAESGGAKKAIAWYKKNLGAQVVLAMCSPDKPDRIGHAELAFGSTKIMLSEAFPGMNKSPEELGGSPISLYVEYPKDSKAAYDNALSDGATVVPGRDYKEQPWGHSAGTIIDPFGYTWTLGENTKGWSHDETAEKLGMKNIAGEF
jgi:PhnB protein